jgi:hypothetical protein
MKNAVETNADFIGITSFNEWFEGTQIEPAVPKTIPSYTYEDYGKDTNPLFYTHKTRELISKYVKIIWYTTNPFSIKDCGVSRLSRTWRRCFRVARWLECCESG